MYPGVQCSFDSNDALLLHVHLLVLNTLNVCEAGI